MPRVSAKEARKQITLDCNFRGLRGSIPPFSPHFRALLIAPRASYLYSRVILFAFTSGECQFAFDIRPRLEGKRNKLWADDSVELTLSEFAVWGARWKILASFFGVGASRLSCDNWGEIYRGSEVGFFMVSWALIFRRLQFAYIEM